MYRPFSEVLAGSRSTMTIREMGGVKPFLRGQQWPVELVILFFKSQIFVGNIPW